MVDRVWLYKDAGFQNGDDFTKSDKDLRWGPWNDEISSIIVEGPGKVVFYEHDNYEGAQWPLTAGRYDLGDLYALGIPNDEITSYQFFG